MKNTCVILSPAFKTDTSANQIEVFWGKSEVLKLRLSTESTWKLLVAAFDKSTKVLISIWT